MSGKPSTPNPFAKKTQKPIIDEVIPDRRIVEAPALAPMDPVRAAQRTDPAAPAKDAKKESKTKPAPGRFRTTVDLERKTYRKVQNYAADLYDFNGGNVTVREVFEAAVNFAFENEALFDAFVKSKLTARED